MKRKEYNAIKSNLLRTLDIFKLVGSSDDSVSSRGNVIFSVVWDDGTTSHKVVVSLENQAGPRHLVRLGLGCKKGLYFLYYFEFLTQLF